MLEIDHVCVTLSGKDIVHPFTHQFAEGSITAIVGLNGAGKSTLLRAIAGLIPCRGRALIQGNEIFQMQHKKRARFISYLPQTLPHPQMDTDTLVSHGRYARQGLSHVLSVEDCQVIGRAMEMTNTLHLKTRQISALSGGERQRVFLAMVIAQDTPVILLDEPDTYMDVMYKRELIQILLKLKELGRIILMTSHDLPQSFQTADNILVMRDGCILGGGKTNNPENVRQVFIDGMGVSVRKMNEAGLCTPYALEWGDQNG